MTKKGKPFLQKDKTIIDFVNTSMSYLSTQLRVQAFNTIWMPVMVSVWMIFYSKAEKGLPTFDIDGAATTLLEMLQPKSVSNIGWCEGVYENDRQVRNQLLTERYVDSRKFELTRVAVWVSESDFLLDIQTIIDYTSSIPVNQEYNQYEDLYDFLVE